MLLDHTSFWDPLLLLKQRRLWICWCETGSSVNTWCKIEPCFSDVHRCSMQISRLLYFFHFLLTLRVCHCRLKKSIHVVTTRISELTRSLQLFALPLTAVLNQPKQHNSYIIFSDLKLRLNVTFPSLLTSYRLCFIFSLAESMGGLRFLNSGCVMFYCWAWVWFPPKCIVPLHPHKGGGCCAADSQYHGTLVVNKAKNH